MQGDPKSRPKSKSNLTLDSRTTVYNKRHRQNRNRRPTGEEGAPRILHKALMGNSPRRGPAPRQRRGRPSRRGEGTQQKKQVRSTHMHDTEHTCHEHDACERTCHANTRHYTYIHPDTGKTTCIPNQITWQTKQKEQEKGTKQTLQK